MSSIGLGGGSLVTFPPSDANRAAAATPSSGGEQQQLHCRVGPASVGAAVTSSSMVCGGTKFTASDVAVLLHDRLPSLRSRAEAAAALQAPVPDQTQLSLAWQVCYAAVGKRMSLTVCCPAGSCDAGCTHVLAQQALLNISRAEIYGQFSCTEVLRSSPTCHIKIGAATMHAMRMLY